MKAVFLVIESKPYPGEQEGGAVVLTIESGAKRGRVELEVDTDEELKLFAHGARVDVVASAHEEPRAAEEPAAEAQADGDAGDADESGAGNRQADSPASGRTTSSRRSTTTKKK
jgi:phosphoribosylamine-glycine ligase